MRAVILTGWIMTLLIIALIVGTTLVMIWTNKIVPDYLSQWMGIALGYVFATFPTMLKDYMDG